MLAISEDEGISRSHLRLETAAERRRAASCHRGPWRRRPQRNAIRITLKVPSQVFLTTTAMDVDEELVNRCLVLTVDESRDQTDAIQSMPA